MIDNPLPGQSDPPQVMPAHPARSAWVPRDIVLLLVGAIVALGGEEWRDAHNRDAQLRAALTSIRDELRSNVTLVERARARHAFLADTLAKLAARGLRPTVEIYSNGMVKPAIVSSTAWKLAQQTGALSDAPLPVLLAIAPAYDAQDIYRALTESLAAEMMSDLRHYGMETVLRDRFAQFIPLDIDFGNREGVLLKDYQRALEHLSAQLRTADRVRGDRDALQGGWRVAALGGDTATGLVGIIGKGTIVVTGDTVVMRDIGNGENVSSRYTFSLDTLPSPHRIDLVDGGSSGGSRWSGIYRIVADTLTLALPIEHWSDRPVPPADFGGPNTLVLILKREKP
jgi:uncharacterized protein (TIGR03067 family)